MAKREREDRLVSEMGWSLPGHQQKRGPISEKMLEALEVRTERLRRELGIPNNIASDNTSGKEQ